MQRVRLRDRRRARARTPACTRAAAEMERLQHCRDARDARLRGSFRRPHQQTGRQVQACVQRCGMGQRS
eukprot:2433450-Pyramimonas_sp.AAC.1